VVHLTTYFDLAAAFFVKEDRDLWHLYVVSFISNKPFGKLQHLASYVSRQYAMAMML
jgi:hypothetical protein